MDEPMVKFGYSCRDTAVYITPNRVCMRGAGEREVLFGGLSPSLIEKYT